MENNFTIDDIKNSVEYKWRKSKIKQNLYVWIISAILTFFVSALFKQLLIWTVFIALLGIFIGCGILYQIIKMKYFLNNYKNFNCYEVSLDNFSPSVLYRNSVFYKVKITENGIIKEANTNPYFSNSSFAKLSPSEYNGQKVIGLYDDKNNKFYILKKQTNILN